MCWGLEVSIAAATVGAASAVVLKKRKTRWPVWGTVVYFSLMEALQIAGYLVVDQCGDPVNSSVAVLSVLHIVFQPFFINALWLCIMQKDGDAIIVRSVYLVCGVSALIMLLQIGSHAFPTHCEPGMALCGMRHCVISGGWHIGWTISYHTFWVAIWQAVSIPASFPTYVLAAFVLPLFYGAWKLVLLHLALGPVVAISLSGNANEWPAIWCLFSLGIVAASFLVSSKFVLQKN